MRHFDTIRATNLRSVSMKNSALCFGMKSGEVWIDTPLSKPFAFDLPSLRNGWAKLAKGQRAEWDLQPDDYEWDEQARDGWIAAAVCQIASAELGGLAELQCLDRRLAHGIVDLRSRYLCHASAITNIPVVTYEVHPITAEIIFKIEGWTPRTKLFGDRVNPPLHGLNHQVPDAELPKPNGSDEIMAKIRARQLAAQAV
jgi:hypothetical protein